MQWRRFEEETMPLENFGSILNFAEELEQQDNEFFTAAAGNPACAEYKAVFEQFAAGKTSLK